LHLGGGALLGDDVYGRADQTRQDRRGHAPADRDQQGRQGRDPVFPQTGEDEAQRGAGNGDGQQLRVLGELPAGGGGVTRHIRAATLPVDPAHRRTTSQYSSRPISSPCVPSQRTSPPRMNTTRSASRSSAGARVTRSVARSVRRRAATSASAMLCSVTASTAVVGSCSTSTGASAATARARAMR